MFSEFEEDLIINQTSIENWHDEIRSKIFGLAFGFIFFVLGIFLSIWRLITAIWWAFLFWVVGLIAGIKNFNFGTSYLAVLNLYIIPLIIETVLLLSSITISFSTTIILGILFGINFWYTKEKK